MITTFAVSGYRSLHDLIMPMSPLTVITGENGSGKSNLYAALRLLSDISRGQMGNALAMQGGLPSTLWAGPETISKRMEKGEVPVQGGPRQRTVRLRLGFACDATSGLAAGYGYQAELGLPSPSCSYFHLDPEIKRESIWNGPKWRRASALVDRHGPLLKRRQGRKWEIITQHLSTFDSLFASAGSPIDVPEVYALKQAITNWRFYADFRTDSHAPARTHRPATRTPVLHHDGRDIAAAIQTIIEIGDAEALHRTIDDAFPGSQLIIDAPQAGMLTVALQQPGLLRPLQCAEWSDGTLQYVLLSAALLTPRPPALMVLNEPESSLHPDLLPALARLIIKASEHTQVWVVSHATRLVSALEEAHQCSSMQLVKNLGRTQIAGLRDLDKPPWLWAGG